MMCFDYFKLQLVHLNVKFQKAPKWEMLYIYENTPDMQFMCENFAQLYVPDFSANIKNISILKSYPYRATTVPSVHAGKKGI